MYMYTLHTVRGRNLRTLARPKNRQPSTGAQNRNLSSSSYDIHSLHNSVMQISDKLSQIMASSAAPSGVRFTPFICLC